MTNSRSLWHTSPTGSKIKTEPLSGLEPGMCIVETQNSLISIGTEKLVATGRVPEELYTQMVIPYMGGNFPFPVKYGYSQVGKVITPGHPLEGKRVHFMHPHQDYCVVRTEDLYPVPDEVPSPRATLASNLETAVNACWDSDVSVGDRVLVVGFGMIGSLVARLVDMIPAVEVCIVDTDLAKRKRAEEMGFFACRPADIEGSFDCAFHASGDAGGLQTCIDSVGFEGKIVELSWYGIKEVDLQLGGSFHSDRKVLISSQVSHLSPNRRGRWDFARRKQVVFELLKSPDFDLHLGDNIQFEKVPEIFARLRKGGPSPFSLCIGY